MNHGQIIFNPPQNKQSQPEPQTNNNEAQKIEELVTKTARVLLKISGIFPFDFFPDELVIDENKVSIIAKGLIDESIYSIAIKDLGDVSVETVFIFASLTISDNRMNHQEIKVKWLDPDEAVRAHNMIQGLILGREQKIDWAKIRTEELAKKVEELGKVKV